MIPTEIANANATSESSTSLAQGNLLQEWFKKVAELLHDPKLSKLCSDAGFLKEIEKGQIFITIEEGSEVMQTACREYTQSRNLTTSRPRRWIRSNTKIGPVLDAKLYPHEGRCCIDIMIESLSKDKTVSWVRFGHGFNKYVTETSQKNPIENVQLFISTGKLVAKAKPRPKSVVNLSSNCALICERIWIDIDPQPFYHSCFAVSKFMTRSLRHDSSIHREEDGAVRFDDLMEKLKERFLSTLQWAVSTWLNSLAKGGGKKRTFQYCLNPYFLNKFMYFCAIQGYAGDDFAENICHIGNAYEMHSIFQSGVIPGGKVTEGTDSQCSSQH